MASSEVAVERGCRFVEQQQWRILEKRPRDGDPLALATRKPHPAVADQRAHAVRQVLDEVAARRESGVEHLLIRGVGSAVADILHDRAVEQGNVLRDNTDGLAQALLCDPSDILAVDQDPAVLRVVETLQQCEQSRFTAARRTNEADAFARHEADAEILENLLAVAVAEVDALEPDAGAAPYQRFGLGMIAQLVRDQQRSQCLREAGNVLRYVDQRHREIPGGVQH